MVSKPLVVAIVSLVLALASKIYGQEIFSVEEEQQIVEIVFSIVAFVGAYLHKREENASK